MMLNKIIEDGSLRATGDGFALKIRLPWYRSLPLSTVEVEAISIDQKPIPLEDVRFSVNGRVRELAELADLEQEFWFVLDSAELLVESTPLRGGTAHDVELVLSLRPPYIKGLQRLVRWSKRLDAN